MVLENLPREKQAYFRQPWIADFKTRPATHNTITRFIEGDDQVVDTTHRLEVGI